MQPICCSEVQSFVKLVPAHFNAFPPSWHDFDDSVEVEGGVLYSLLLTNNHLHFLIILDCARNVHMYSMCSGIMLKRLHFNAILQVLRLTL